MWNKFCEAQIMKRRLLLLFFSLLVNSLGYTQVLDTIIIKCPSLAKYFSPGPSVTNIISSPTPILSKKELRELVKYEKTHTVVITDSIYEPYVCDSILSNKNNSNYYLKVYDYSGVLRHEGEYLGYKPSGKIISYYRNGNPLEQKEYKLDIVNGTIKRVETGTWITYRISGEIIEKIDK